MLIDGDIVFGLGATQSIRNPADGLEIAEIHSADPTQVDRVARAAARALPAWRQKSPMERAELLLSLATIIESRGYELAQIESLNVGKPLHCVIQDEIPHIVDCLRFYAGAARSLSGVAAGEYVAGATSFIRRDPIGVVGLIAPWNYPLMMAVWKIAPALALGNTVIFKPSELTPLSIDALLEWIANAFPPGVVNVVYGGADVGAALTAHPSIAMISLTGSPAAGSQVASTAAKNYKRTHLELGGKAPAIIFADANLDAVVAGVRAAGFYNAGQDCTAACRILVEHSIARQLTEQLATDIASLRLGPPSESSTEMGPLISAAQRDRVHGYVSRTLTRSEGRLIAGGVPLDGAGWFYPPTLITDVDANAEIAREEVFGPVLTVTPFDGEDEAIRFANAADYGLASSIWTSDIGRAFRLIPNIEAGITWVNTHFTYAAEMPHGGVKRSGHGSDLSIYGAEAYSQIRHIMISHQGQVRQGTAHA